ncbi:hypothetical protein F383_09085 [Gossypium arboreum]|uniref:Uncharacterized protein n=1 Tax=Gossypium arboreum TaxID=29729 RepID=A0A0B0PMX1_GOSAR|nr:hypothetical protein F383_09085 [Gossypium arboreum]
MHQELDVKDFNGYQLLSSACCSPIMENMFNYCA